MTAVLALERVANTAKAQHLELLKGYVCCIWNLRKATSIAKMGYMCASWKIATTINTNHCKLWYVTLFDHVFGSMCEEQERAALSAQTENPRTLSSLRVKNVNRHTDQAGRGRHPRNSHRCWALISFGLTNVSIVPSIKRVEVAILILFFLAFISSLSSYRFSFLRSYLLCASKTCTVTGIRRVGVAMLVIFSVVELSHLASVSNVSTVIGLRRLEVAIFVIVIFWAVISSFHVKQVNSHKDQAGRRG